MFNKIHLYINNYSDDNIFYIIEVLINMTKRVAFERLHFLKKINKINNKTIFKNEINCKVIATN